MPKKKKPANDPQKIIEEMKLKERPSYGQRTQASDNPMRAAAEKAVSQPTSAQQRYSDQTSRAASDRDKRKSSQELQKRAAATEEFWRAHLPEKSE